MTKNCLQNGNDPPRGREEWFLYPFVLTRWEMVQPVLTKAVLQRPKASTMCTAYLENARPPPPSHLFLLAQKWIAPTDNMCPKGTRLTSIDSTGWLVVWGCTRSVCRSQLASCCVYNVYQATEQCTNNHLVGWHNRLNKFVGRPHPNLFELIRTFQQEEASTHMTILQLATGGQSCPHKKWCVVEIDRRIETMM